MWVGVDSERNEKSVLSSGEVARGLPAKRVIEKKCSIQISGAGDHHLGTASGKGKREICNFMGAVLKTK